MRKKRTPPTLNAGSMADIAFLLLIFFLVVTTIAEDKGIPVILPEYYEGPPGPMPDRNVLALLVNGNNEILIESVSAEVDEVTVTVVDFVMNSDNSLDKPRVPADAVISIQNDADTEYEVYIQIYSAIHEAYRIMRSDMAMNEFGVEFDQVSINQKNEILIAFPLKLSEADPFIN